MQVITSPGRPNFRLRHQVSINLLSQKTNHIAVLKCAPFQSAYFCKRPRTAPLTAVTKLKPLNLTLGMIYLFTDHKDVMVQT